MDFNFRLDFLENELNRLHTENQFLRTCSVYGIQTRQALELDWVNDKTLNGKALVYCDLDGLRDFNTTIGHFEVDKLIRQAFQSVRSNELYAARYYSGDEFVFFVDKQAVNHAVKRIQNAFKVYGLTATFAIVPCQEGSLESNANLAQFLVETAKNNGNRNSVISMVLDY